MKITTVLGLSGSGKSTLLQLINGLLIPQEGRITIFGSPINYNSLPSHRKGMGYVVQGTGLFPHLTVRNNIALSAMIHKETISESRIEELLSALGLPSSTKTSYPYQLSGGEQQRAAICMALYRKPPVLLMDESLGALDIITRTEIQNQLLELQRREKTTIVFVTHDVPEALRLGDFLLILKDGQAEEFGEPEKILSAPKSPFVSKLLETASKLTLTNDKD